MEKEYYKVSEEQIDYLIEKMQGTKIEESYLPIIGDIMLRRKFEFKLSDELFKRDINTFIENVKRIEVKDLEKAYGLYDHVKKKIVLNSILFKEGKFNTQKRLEKIYSTLVHESVHAMNFTKNKRGRKEDRAFLNNNKKSNKGIMEAFTECEADELVYNKLPFEISIDGNINKRNTESYRKLTHYIDIIALAFGVKRKELITEKIKGKKELQSFLNSHVHSVDEKTGENIIFEGIEENIEKIYYETYKQEQKDQEKINHAQLLIYSLVEVAINERINNIKVNDSNELEKQFDKIILGQKLIDYLMADNYSKENLYRFHKNEFEEYKIANTKLICIQEILENNNITEKKELIQKVQKCNTLVNISKFIKENNISVTPRDRQMELSERLKEYGFAEPDMRWQNYTDIMKYIMQNQKDMNVPPEPSKFKVLTEKIKKFFHRKDVKMIPEKTMPMWWDLSEWGINKEEFIIESQKNNQRFISTQKTTNEVDLGEKDHEH